MEHFFFSTECQMKGSLHWHGLIWIVDAPRSMASLQSWLAHDDANIDDNNNNNGEPNRNKLVNWADAICKESLPPVPPKYDAASVSFCFLFFFNFNRRR